MSSSWLACCALQGGGGGWLVAVMCFPGHLQLQGATCEISLSALSGVSTASTSLLLNNDVLGQNNLGLTDKLPFAQYNCFASPSPSLVCLYSEEASGCSLIHTVWENSFLICTESISLSSVRGCCNFIMLSVGMLPESHASANLIVKSFLLRVSLESS